MKLNVQFLDCTHFKGSVATGGQWLPYRTATSEMENEDRDKGPSRRHSSDDALLIRPTGALSYKSTKLNILQIP